MKAWTHGLDQVGKKVGTDLTQNLPGGRAVFRKKAVL